MTVLGIDVSLTCTGLAVAKYGTITETVAVKTKASGPALADRTQRLATIGAEVYAVIDRVRPTLAVIEAPSLASKFGQPHERSGVWWAIVQELSAMGVLIAEVSPMQRAKYGSGKGNAKKEVVHSLVQAHYARADLPIKTNDEADAVILAAMGARRLGQSVEPWELENDRLSAMDKVNWPC